MANSGESLDQSDIEPEIKKVNAAINEQETLLDGMSDSDKDLIDFIDFAINFIDQLRANWDKVSPDNRLRCQQLLFPDGISYHSKRKVGTTTISPLYRLATNKKDPALSSESHLVEHHSELSHLVLTEIQSWRKYLGAKFNRYRNQTQY